MGTMSGAERIGSEQNVGRLAMPSNWYISRWVSQDREDILWECRLFGTGLTGFGHAKSTQFVVAHLSATTWQGAPEELVALCRHSSCHKIEAHGNWLSVRGRGVAETGNIEIRNSFLAKTASPGTWLFSSTLVAPSFLWKDIRWLLVTISVPSSLASASLFLLAATNWCMCDLCTPDLISASLP